MTEQPTSAAYEVAAERARNAPHGSETRARCRVVPVRVDDAEHTRWSAFAARKGLSLAGLLRLSVESVITQDEILEAHRG
jgi:hypothetical protein